VRSRLIGYVDEIIAEASGAEINEQKAKWAVTELLTNATQYARLSENNDRAGLIRLEWRITRDKSAPSLALAISNPCPTLFDPTRYALMSIADFYSMEPSTTNGHLGTIALVGYLQPHSHLSYVWELPNEERISCALQLIQESDSDKPLNFEEIMKPVRVGVAKFGPHNEPLSYSREDFYRDVQNGLRTRTVSVSCII
jgi:anti-sigma regulatory factor (Ser/Thr protein kinase)